MPIPAETRREVLAIIPARGGSKGLPRKNVLPLAGRPLVAHSIEQARAAALVTRVVVSTEDPEIEAASLRAGAEVVPRPPELAGDAASSESALLHALEFLAARDYRPELVAFLQCTSPLTLAEDIDGTIRALLDADADTALAVAPFHHFLWREETLGDAVGINHDKAVRLRRQDRPADWLETGAVYVMRTEGFLRARHRFFGRTAIHAIPRERLLEIDDPTDFEVAEVLIRARERARAFEAIPSPLDAIVMDFDGVFTDDRVFVREDGVETVACSRSDGLGLGFLKRLGVPMLVLSKERNPVVAARCRKLGLECLQGVDDKPPAMLAWLERVRADPARTIYVGNDVNDLGCLARVGCPVAPADAREEARRAARIVLSKPGGRGALRELCDRVRESLERGRPD